VSSGSTVADGAPRKVERRLSPPAFEVTLNRPERKNALDIETIDLLCAALDEAERSPARAVILKGAGGTFCSGADLAQFGESDDSVRDDAIARFGAAFETACSRIAFLELPVIAAIEGAALGGGATLALFSDFRLATADARLCIPASKLGITLSEMLVRRIVAVTGQRGAVRLLLPGHEFESAEALARGLVDEVVATTQELHDRATSLVLQISEAGRESVAAHKQAINRILAEKRSD
jgi:enoyl-CoA hydratase/carnithine racemase